MQKTYWYLFWVKMCCVNVSYISCGSQKLFIIKFHETGSLWLTARVPLYIQSALTNHSKYMEWIYNYLENTFSFISPFSRKIIWFSDPHFSIYC